MIVEETTDLRTLSRKFTRGVCKFVIWPRNFRWIFNRRLLSVVSFPFTLKARVRSRVIAHSSTSHRDPAKVKVSDPVRHPRSSWTHSKRWNFRVTQNGMRAGAAASSRTPSWNFLLSSSSRSFVLLIYVRPEKSLNEANVSNRRNARKFRNLFSYLLSI